MSIFGKIKNAIFGGEAKAAEPEVAATPVAAAPAKRAAISEVDVTARLDSIPGSDKLNWRTSIVDLMKLVQIDASYGNRKELAQELGRQYPAAQTGHEQDRCSRRHRSGGTERLIIWTTSPFEIRRGL